MRELLRNKDKGVTLLEILAFIVIVGIIVCNSNVKEVERMYESQLALLSNIHSENQFKELLLEFGQEICPKNGIISYVDGKVKCSFLFTR